MQHGALTFCSVPENSSSNNLKATFKITQVPHGVLRYESDGHGEVHMSVVKALEDL